MCTCTPLVELKLLGVEPIRSSSNHVAAENRVARMRHASLCAIRQSRSYELVDYRQRWRSGLQELPSAEGKVAEAHGVAHDEESYKPRLSLTKEPTARLDHAFNTSRS